METTGGPLMFGSPTRKVRGFFLLRRLLAEARGIRRALERQADLMELSSVAQPRESLGAQVFRTYARREHDLSDQAVESRTEVSYADDKLLGQMLEHEEELRAILGREPTEVELERALRGDIE